MLSADPLFAASGIETLEQSNSSVALMTARPVLTSPPPTLDMVQEESVGGSGGLMPVSPFPLNETFQLHSLPGATKTIYLDFNGHTTQFTNWNTDYERPIIISPTFSSDGDLLNFSSSELLTIQNVWERMAEDFRPFGVNVTTQDPGLDALTNTSDMDPGDDTWGIRVVFGGSTNDWFTPISGTAAGGVAYIGSFTDSIDTPTFVFAGDSQDEVFLAEAGSHEVGHTLGLIHDGQHRFYRDISQMPPEFARLYLEYYPGHGSGPTSWAPIMGVGYAVELTQWSKGDYFNSTNDEDGLVPLQDDLAVITTGNGFGYRPDDHGSAVGTATPIALDSDGDFIEAEGIIEQNTDVDVFSFVVDGLGEIINFDITPFHRGPNLDILAKILDASGTELYRSNPLDDLTAGGQTTTYGDGGWFQLDEFGEVIGEYLSEVVLLPGTYYLTIEGTGRPITYLDSLFHPGPYDWDPEGEDPLPPDTSDFGYDKYGSLGYYSIAGSRKKGLLVGVDFDIAGGMSPQNWTLYSGGATTTLNDLVGETGLVTEWDLTINTSLPAVASPALDNSVLPAHDLPLNQLSGYLGGPGETMSFVWSDLDPAEVYHVYVFGSANVEAENVVTVTGGEWLGTTQIYDFTQTISPNTVVVHDANGEGSYDSTSTAGHELSTLALLVIADELGQITVEVDSGMGMTSAIAGLAISPTQRGTISGQKWNDVDGDGGQPEVGEEGLPNWLIYLDMNNNEQLDVISTPELPVTQASPDVPQAITDYNVVKSELNFTQVGEIADINVSLNIAHTAVGDLNVWLLSPSGTIVKLFDDVGGNADNITATMDDESSNFIPQFPGTPTISGTFHPDSDLNQNYPENPHPFVNNLLSAFDGESAAGVWTLVVFDDGPGDSGQINGWSLEVTIAESVTYLEPVAFTDSSGNYLFEDVKPGQYYVREHIQDFQLIEGWRQSWAPPPVTVTSKAQVTGVDFGNWVPVFTPGSISGQKWNDEDGNGVKDEGEEGLADWTIYLDLNNNGVLDLASVPTTFVAADLPKPITDFATTTSVINVGNLGTVLGIEVTLDITHSFMADLDAFLTSPSGRIVELFTGVGAQFNDFNNLTLADDAAESIASIGQDDLPYTGTWRPEGSLSEFLGDEAAGNWTLTIRDTTFADQGTLNSWSIDVIVGEPFTETDEDGNYSLVDLPPDQYIVREVLQPGWTQTHAPQMQLDPMGNPYNVDLPLGEAATGVNFGNQSTAPALLGDYNRDGFVDVADWVMLQKTKNTSVPAPYDGADGNGDTMVTQADTLPWQQNFGSSEGGEGGEALAEGGGSGGMSAMSASESYAVASEAPSAEPNMSVLEEAPASKPTSTFVLSEFTLSKSFGFTTDTSDSSSAVAASSGNESIAGAGEAAMVAWLDSLEDADDQLAGDSFSLSSLSDGADSESSDELEGIDALFELLGV